MLWACDFDWWDKNAGVPSFAGLKLGNNECVARPEWGLKQVRILRGDDHLRLDTFGTIGWGGNGGFHALNLAVQFGVRRIILVGYDMRLDRGVHWHGKHGGGLTNPTVTSVERWRRVLDAAAPLLEDIGVEVLNASPVSTLTAYKKIDFEEAMDAAA